MSIVIVVLLVIGLIFLFHVWRTHKKPILNSINLVTGGVKTGKSTLSLALAFKKYNSNVLKWCFVHAVYKSLFIRKKEKDFPYFYSNIPVKVSVRLFLFWSYDWFYVPLTRSILRREKNVHLNSVFYVGEISLVADSMCFKDDVINEQLLLWLKLFGHQCNGAMFIDTQCFNDCHYSVKRVLNRFIYIERMIKLPFFLIFRVREFINVNEQTVNTLVSDIEDNTKWLICFKSIWKKFDYRCYSVLTDNLEKHDKLVDGTKLKNLKCNDIVSFKNFKSIQLNEGGVNNE